MIKKIVILVIFSLLTSISYAQKKEKEKLETEEITVVKPYTPTISDAFKIKSEPQLDSVEIGKKKEVKYTINSIPVASTFTPAKGKAKSLQRSPKERIYNNYVSAGFGNYTTPIIEIFAHSNTTNYNDFGGFLNYHSSGGGIDGIKLDDNFSDFNLDLYYKQTERYFEWQINTGISNLVSNWYGLSDEINYTNTVIKSIDENQSFSEIYVSGEIEFFDALVHRGDVKLSRFFDKAESAENYALANGIVDFPIGREIIYTKISLEFLNGNFDQTFLTSDNIEYNFFNLGISPNFQILREDLTVNVGAKLYYSITDTDAGSKFYAYPNITASYNIDDEVFIAFAGVTGDLQQNSYKSFVEENPFVSPTLDIQRTSQQYYAYGGIKGLLNSNFNFNAKVAYGSESDKPLFKLNPSKTNGNTVVENGYEAGNSFEIIYDDVTTIQASAELIVDFTKEIKFGGNIEYNMYSLDTQDHAWNLPMLKSTLLASYTQKKWSAGADLFFATDRKDEITIIPTSSTNRITNSAYFDVNLNGIYHFNDKFSAFVNFNNILSTNYQQYTNFKVQGFQFFGGLKYKFDL
jgi:hypothetical protein